MPLRATIRGLLATSGKNLTKSLAVFWETQIYPQA